MIFNKETGEILEGSWENSVQEVLPARYIKPFIISDVTNKEVFEERVKDTTARRKFRLWVSSLIPDLIVDKELSIAELGVFCYLATNIGYGYHVYTSIKDLVEGTGYVRQTVYKALDRLEEGGFIRKCSNKLTAKEDRMYMVNPLYFYLGYYPNRDNALKDWMLGH